MAVVTANGPIDRESLGITLPHEHLYVVPAMRRKGISQAGIDTILVENPKALLDVNEKYL
jgi:predicted metal-dependent phosphotriesterase family hydrolase